MGRRGGWVCGWQCGSEGPKMATLKGKGDPSEAQDSDPRHGAQFPPQGPTHISLRLLWLPGLGGIVDGWVLRVLRAWGGGGLVPLPLGQGVTGCGSPIPVGGSFRQPVARQAESKKSFLFWPVFRALEWASVERRELQQCCQHH